MEGTDDGLCLRRSRVIAGGARTYPKLLNIPKQISSTMQKAQSDLYFDSYIAIGERNLANASIIWHNMNRHVSIHSLFELSFLLSHLQASSNVGTR